MTIRVGANEDDGGCEDRCGVEDDGGRMVTILVVREEVGGGFGGRREFKDIGRMVVRTRCGVGRWWWG